MPGQFPPLSLQRGPHSLQHAPDTLLSRQEGGGVPMLPSSALPPSSALLLLSCPALVTMASSLQLPTLHATLAWGPDSRNRVPLPSYPGGPLLTWSLATPLQFTEMAEKPTPCSLSWPRPRKEKSDRPWI